MTKKGSSRLAASALFVSRSPRFIEELRRHATQVSLCVEENVSQGYLLLIVNLVLGVRYYLLICWCLEKQVLATEKAHFYFSRLKQVIIQ